MSVQCPSTFGTFFLSAGIVQLEEVWWLFAWLLRSMGCGGGGFIRILSPWNEAPLDSSSTPGSPSHRHPPRTTHTRELISINNGTGHRLHYAVSFQRSWRTVITPLCLCLSFPAL